VLCYRNRVNTDRAPTGRDNSQMNDDSSLDKESAPSEIFATLLKVVIENGFLQLPALGQARQDIDSASIRLLNLSTHCSHLLLHINQAIDYLRKNLNHGSEKLLVERIADNFGRTIKSIIFNDIRTLNDISRDIIEISELLRYFKINPNSRDTWLQDSNSKQFRHSNVAKEISNSQKLPKRARRPENREYEFHSMFLHPTHNQVSAVLKDKINFEQEILLDFIIHFNPIMAVILSDKTIAIQKEFLDFHNQIFEQLELNEANVKLQGVNLPNHEIYYT